MDSKAFQEADIDKQLTGIDRWYDDRMDGEEEGSRQSYAFNKSMLRGMHEMDWMEKNDTPARATFAAEAKSAYADLYKKSQDPLRAIAEDIHRESYSPPVSGDPVTISKPSAKTKVDRARDLIEFNDRLTKASDGLQKHFNRQSLLKNNAGDVISERRELEDLRSRSEQRMAGGPDMVGMLPTTKVPDGPGERESAIMRAGFTPDEIEASIADLGRATGRNETPVDTHFDQLSSGEVVFTPQGLLFPDDARKRIESSNIAGGAKRRALQRLDEESIEHSRALWDEMSRSKTIGGDLKELQSKNGGDWRKALQAAWSDSKASPYLAAAGTGFSKGVYDVAAIIPSISSALTGGVVGEDTRRFLEGQGDAFGAAGSFATDAGVTGGADRFGLGLTSGVASAVPQLAFQLGAAKGIAGLAANKGNVGFATSVGLSGAQSFSMEYGEALKRGLGQGGALHAGMLSGTVTALTTAGFGKTGVESIFDNPAAKAGLKEYFGSIMVNAGQEGVEEFTDEFINGLVASANYGENRPIEKIVGDALMAGSVGILTGGGIRAIHGTGRDLVEPEKVEAVRPDVSPVPAFDYDFDSETIGEKPNADRIVQNGDKFTVADENFDQEFDTREEAEAFSRTRYFEKYKENIASQFGDPEDPNLKVAIEAAARLGDGLARSGVNPDKEFFANILSQEEVDSAIADMKAKDEARLASRKESEGKLTEDVNAAREEQENPAPEPDRKEVANQPEALYRNLIETPGQEARSEAIGSDIGSSIETIQARVDELKGRTALNEDEQTELETNEQLLSNAILEESDATRASGDPAVTRADIAPEQTRENGPGMDEAFERARIDGLRKKQGALQKRYGKLKNKETPAALKLEEEITDLESEIQTPEPSRAPVDIQPSASPTTETDSSTQQRAQQITTGIRDILGRADLNSSADSRADLSGKVGGARMRTSQAKPKWNTQENVLQFFDRKGGYKQVIEQLRTTSNLDEVALGRLDELGQEMMGVVNEWVDARPGPTRDATLLQEGNRGNIRKLDTLRGVVGANRVLIAGFNSGDPTTLIHETFHALQLLQGSDGRSLLDIALGPELESFNKWTTRNGTVSPTSVEALERATVGFEQYLATGKSPVPQMDGVFKRLANLFRSVYAGVRNILQSVPEHLGGGHDLSADAIRAYDRIFGGINPDGSVTPAKRASEVGKQPEPGPLAPVQSDGRFRMPGGSVQVPTAAGQPQKGFKNTRQAFSFRKKAALRLGIPEGAMKLEKDEEGRYFVTTHPVANPRLFGNTATGNTAEASTLNQGRNYATPDRLWTNGEYSIGLDPHPQAYAMGWTTHRLQLKRGDEMVGRLDLFENPQNKGWYEVALSNIEPAHRGKKLGIELYRQALASLPPGIKGVSSDLELRTNQKQIPTIYHKFGGYEEKGFAFLPRRDIEPTKVPDASRLSQGLASAAGSTLRIDGLSQGLTDTAQVRVEFQPRSRRQVLFAMFDEASDLGTGVHEIGEPVTSGETGLQSDGTYAAPFLGGRLREAIPWSEFADIARRAGIENFTYNEDTGDVSLYELENTESLVTNSETLTSEINADRKILGVLSPEVRRVRAYSPETGALDASRNALGQGSAGLSRAQVLALTEAATWVQAMNPGHANDPLVKDAYRALDEELGIVMESDPDITRNERRIREVSATLSNPLAKWALISTLRGSRAAGGVTVPGLLPLALAATGDSKNDLALEGLATKLRGSSRGDYVLMGSAAGSNDLVSKAMEPQEDSQADEIALARTERFSREMDRDLTLGQVNLPTLRPHTEEKRVSSMPTGLANFFFKPIAKLLGGSTYSPWRQVARALESNPLHKAIAAWWRYRDLALRASRKVSREMFHKHGDVWKIDAVTGNVGNFTSQPSAAVSWNYIDVIEAEMENPGTYPLDNKQKAWISDARQVIQDMVKQMVANGIPMAMFLDSNGQIDYSKLDSNFYFPRRAIGSIDTATNRSKADRANRQQGGSGGGPRSARGFDKSRKYSTAMEGVNDGITYDPDPLSALEGFLRDAYSKIGDFRTINDPDLAGNSNLSSLKRGTRIARVGDIEAVFDEVTAKALEDWTTKKLEQWPLLANTKNGLGYIRALKLGIDFSAPVIQGAIVSINHPISSVKSQIAAWKEFFKEGGSREFFLKREPLIKEMVESGSAFGAALDYQDIAMDVGRDIRDKAGRTGRFFDFVTGRFNRFHSTFMDAAAVEFWGSLRRHAIDPATGQLDPDKARQVAVQVDRLVGRESMASYGFSKNSINAMQLFATAPSMYVAYGNLLGSLFSKDPVEAKIAWGEMTKFAAGGTLAFIGSALAVGMEWPEIQERLKPWNSKFLTVQATMPGSDDIYEFGVGGFFRSVTRMMGQLAVLGFDNRNNTSEDVFGPLQAFAGGRIAPGISLALNLMRGTDHFGTSKDTARLVVEGIAPVALTDVTVRAVDWASKTGAAQKEIPFLDVSIAEMFGIDGNFMTAQEKAFTDSTTQSLMVQLVGLNSYPMNKRAQWYQESEVHAKTLFNKEYKDLAPAERIVVVEMNTALRGAPPDLSGFDLDDFLRSKSNRVKEYVDAPTRRALDDMGLLEKGIPGPQAFKTLDNVAVPMTKPEQIEMEKTFGSYLNQMVGPLAPLKAMLPQEDYEKLMRDSIKQAEDMAMMRAGWPQ